MFSINTYPPVSPSPATESKSNPKTVTANMATLAQTGVSANPLKAKTPVAATSFSNGTVQFTSRKDAARQKIAWLKMQLDGLMRFAGVAGNPREAIRLAKELAAAVREYGGSDTAPAAPQAALNIAPQTANSGEAGVAGATEDTANTANTAASTPTASEASAAASTAANLAAQVSASAQVATDSSTTSSQDRAQDKAQNSIQNSEQNSAAASAQVKQAVALASEVKHFTQTGQSNNETGSSKASDSLAALAQVNTSGLSPQDRAFLAEAKILMGKIKLLIAIESKKAEDDKKAREAIQEMDNSFKSATMSLMQENTSLAYAANGLSVSKSSSTPSLSETA